jgi:type IV secretion system protein VirB1
MQVVLSQLLHACAGNIAPKTMGAVVSVESGGNPLAMHDNTQNRSFEPPDMATAISWSTQLIARGDSVDMGLSQVNSTNLPRLGLSVRSAFEPCSNLRAGATILSADYASASAQFGPGQYALRRALSAYNSGSMFAAQGYVDRILVAAGVPPDEPPAVPVASRPRAHGPVAAAIATPKPPYTETTDADSGVVIINGNP